MAAREVERAGDRHEHHEHDDADRRDEGYARVLARPRQVDGDDEHGQRGQARDRQQREDRVGVELDHRRALGQACGEVDGGRDARQEICHGHLPELRQQPREDAEADSQDDERS